MKSLPMPGKARLQGQIYPTVWKHSIQFTENGNEIVSEKSLTLETSREPGFIDLNLLILFLDYLMENVLYLT